MAGLKVEAVGVAQLLELLKRGSWQVPSFQRDFVWSESDVVNLVLSIIEARPIGMATLWEQPDDAALKLEPVLIPDTAEPEGEPVARFADLRAEDRPKKYFAILDGRQRCTAIAMAFGGLRAKDARRRFSGRYFLDVNGLDESDRVKYLKEQEIRQRGLQSEAVCFANGLYPLASYVEGEPILHQWVRYLQSIHQASNYPDAKLPDADEIARRNAILNAAFDGINQTLLAVYIVPEHYSLGDICEIFETLNTTGTKVSTVDLLHSWLYSETVVAGPVLQLREWIDDLGQLPGAAGWSSRNERPELVAQMVTASYLGLDSEKPEPRAVGRRKAKPVTSVKAGDLLATPTAFWRDVIEKQNALADYIGAFQQAVAGAYFPMRHCPYPVTAALYVSIRWYMDNDARFRGHWSKQELDALYRAFFWRNALTTRYDQGFLTQSAKDLKELKDLLFSRGSFASSNQWSTEASSALARLIEKPMPSREWLIEKLTDSRPQGALGKALMLPLLANAQADLLDPKLDLSYPHDGSVDLHHVYPKDWCRNNKAGVLANALDAKIAGRNYCDSVSNLMALSRESNSWWRARAPGLALQEGAVTFDNAQQRFGSQFISRKAYESLVATQPEPKQFWDERASAIADYLLQLSQVDIK